MTMGTNYYLQNPACECCGRSYEPLHIGKSSGGWCFQLHVMPELGINTLDDWRVLWSAPGAYIIDEYGNRISIGGMELIITVRSHPGDFCKPKMWRGYQSEEDFHDLNYSQRGPNGLLRARIGKDCIGHGEGTYDYIVGRFS